MPIYEYRCAEGHTFEVFQRMADPPVSECHVCGERSVEKVLYPVAIHFKGSGFYATDYGRGNRKREAASQTEGGGAEKADEKKPDKQEKTAAETS